MSTGHVSGGLIEARNAPHIAFSARVVSALEEPISADLTTQVRAQLRDDAEGEAAERDEAALGCLLEWLLPGDDTPVTLEDIELGPLVRAHELHGDIVVNGGLPWRALHEDPSRALARAMGTSLVRLRISEIQSSGEEVDLVDLVWIIRVEVAEDKQAEARAGAVQLDQLLRVFSMLGPNKVREAPDPRGPRGAVVAALVVAISSLNNLSGGQAV
eukprot:Hpha_TRINITY_DN22211_c0_g1::TRINITY_DN22211_c0_g1_i1::g.167097::m.167097